MAIVITLDYEAQNPRTLFVMDDEAAAIAHAEQYCSLAGLEFDPTKLRIRNQSNGRTFVVQWTWPRAIKNIWKGDGRWVWLHAGVELTRIELHTCVPADDLQYLIGRVRGAPLEEE